MKFGYEWNEKLCTLPAHGRLMNRLHRQTGQLHKDLTLPGHFIESAFNKYHYKKRSRRYLKWKKRKYGADRAKLPLVATGLLREIVLEKSRVTATKKGWRIYAKGYFPMRAEMRREIEVINKKEVVEYCRELGRDYQKLVRTPQYLRTRQSKKKG